MSLGLFIVACLYVHIYAKSSICIHTRGMYTGIHTCISTCVHACRLAHAQMHVQACANQHIHVHNTMATVLLLFYYAKQIEVGQNHLSHFFAYWSERMLCSTY